MVYFLNQTFNSKRDRNAYAFENKSSLIWDLEQKKNSSIGWGVFGGFILGLIIGIATSSWIMFFVGLVLLPLILHYLKTSQIKKVEKYAQQYEEFLNKTEIDVRNILQLFTKRYFTAEQQVQHISDLTNLINHKEKLNLTEKACKYILIKNEKEKNIDLFDKEISKLKNKSANNLAKVLIKLVPEIDFENEEDYQSILGQLCEYLERKKIEYDVEELKQELISEFKLLKANQFEERLLRNPDKRITVEEIEHLNGFEFEELIGEFFRKAGYKVKVTKKSGDQGADLIVEKEGVSTAIQTKKYAGSVGNTAVQEVVAGMKYYDCDKSIVITTGKFTKGAFELAGRNGVQLIDKKGLDDLFDSIL